MLHPTELFHALLESLETMGGLAYWVVALVSMLESLAFVGWLVPGGLFVISAGFFAATGVFQVDNLIIAASAGTIIGEALSYYFGTQGTKLFKYENKILKLSHLEKGQKFFKRYGIKSIFISRFIGPLRPIIPFVAGLAGISKKVFFIWNIPSGIIWAAMCVYIGYFFGGVWGTFHFWNIKVFLIASFVIFLAILAYLFRSGTDPEN